MWTKYIRAFECVRRHVVRGKIYRCHENNEKKPTVRRDCFSRVSVVVEAGGGKSIDDL